MFCSWEFSISHCFCHHWTAPLTTSLHRYPLLCLLMEHLWMSMGTTFSTWRNSIPHLQFHMHRSDLKVMACADATMDAYIAEELCMQSLAEEEAHCKVWYFPSVSQLPPLFGEGKLQCLSPRLKAVLQTEHQPHIPYQSLQLQRLNDYCAGAQQCLQHMIFQRVKQ